ncbi:MAG: Ig-like domain-containing protein [Nannocystaceae bacterium]|nr:Ig-like domain-containing protein [bacterium]
MDWVGALWRGVPLAVGAITLFASAEAAAERVVFINLGSVALNSDNGQDPTLDSYSSNGFTPGTASGFALTDEEIALLEFYLKEASTPFDIQFVFERPAAGSYDMVVFGNETDADALFADSDCPPAIGLADCGDSSGQNISFVFQGCLPIAQQTDMRRIAYYSLTGLGFGWGLENEVSTGQIMGSYSVFGLQFGNECVGISGGTCPTHPGCPDGEQNATADLNVVVGARVDDGPPVVTITEPADGSTVTDTFTIAADVEDGFGGLTVTMSTEIAGMKVSQGSEEPPYTWELQGVPPGTWTLDVEAIDADGGAVTSSVTVTVDGKGGGETGSTGGDDTTGGVDPSDSDDSSDPSTSGDPTVDPTDASGSGTTDDAGESGSAPIDPTAPVDPATFGAGGTGCQCATSKRPGSDGWGALGCLGVLLLGLTARRPRGRTSTRPSRTSRFRARTSR